MAATVGLFLEVAFVSWYRGDRADQCNLGRYDNLDAKHRALFLRMLELRHRVHGNLKRMFELKA